MKRPYVIINIRLGDGSHSKCQATKLPLKIKSLPSSKERLKGRMEKFQIQRTLQMKFTTNKTYLVKTHLVFFCWSCPR